VAFFNQFIERKLKLKVVLLINTCAAEDGASLMVLNRWVDKFELFFHVIDEISEFPLPIHCARLGR
jgi:hypothetical protein